MASFVITALILLLQMMNPGAEAQQEVKPGTKLSAGDSNPVWGSKGGNFSFGFFSSGSASYVLGVGFATLNSSAAAQALAWTPGHVSALDSGASVTFQSDGDLVLSNSSSGTVLWRSGTANKGATAAVMRDTGDFEILGPNRSSVLWSSFDNPSTSLVLGQSLPANKSLQNGVYSFGIDSHGNLTLKWRQNITYWNFTTGQKSSSLSVNFGSQGILSLVNSSGSSPLWMVRSVDYTDSSITMRTVRLDADGNLRAYSWHDDSKSWQVGWRAVDDQCRVYGVCGNMGVCVYNDTVQTCVCPSGDFVAQDASDPSKGCRRLQDLSTCNSNQSMVQLNHTLFLSYPPESDSNIYNLGVSDCQSNCLNNPSCFASTLMADGSGQCRFRATNFSSAYMSLALSSTSYIKVCGAGRPLSFSPSTQVRDTAGAGGSSSNKKAIVIAVVGSGAALVMIELGLVWILCRRRGGRFGSGSRHDYHLVEYASGAPVQFSHGELQQYTKGFKDKVGSGGFGMVYKGTLPTGVAVAVKRLEGIEQGEKQFRMEVAAIGSTHHLNLVKLVGFCSERRHRLLVYEFMKNKSLDRFLFASADKQSKRLDWSTRFAIALGTARGIAYLHEECRSCIVHCDIKPENILLDDNFVAKVSDFGLAKLLHGREPADRAALSSVRGTRGYVGPEWLANQPLTSKFDVFGYGMVLLEIVGGCRNFDVSEASRRMRFSKWAFEKFQSGNVAGIVDQRLGGSYDEEEVLRAVKVSFWCIQDQPAMRPSMGKVVQMLEGILAIENPPFPKSSCDGGTTTHSSYTASTGHSTDSALPSSLAAVVETDAYVSGYEPNAGEVLSCGR